jgi:hypothetical protein
MRFEIRPPFIIFHDDKPGEHATLFAANGQKLPFRGDESSFNNARREYAWAFEGTVKEEDRIVFASSAHEVVGQMFHGGIVIERYPMMRGVEHDVTNKPTHVTGELLPQVEAVLELPHPPSRPRPIPMTRSK